MSWTQLWVIAFLLFFAFVPVVDVHAQSQTQITPVPTVDYALAYPGILPDNPLYLVKLLRDNIVESLISTTENKINFYLKQTDKRMGMVTMLLDKNKVALAKETALSAEHNYTKLVVEYKLSHTKPTSGMRKTLAQATKKHQEILQNAIKKVEKKDRAVFEQVLMFSKMNQREIEKLSGKDATKQTPSPSATPTETPTL